jgi:hypothetical protein
MKTQIIEELGEGGILLPALVTEGLPPMTASRCE